jgi:hypothetical protein
MYPQGELGITTSIMECGEHSNLLHGKHLRREYNLELAIKKEKQRQIDT